MEWFWGILRLVDLCFNDISLGMYYANFFAAMIFADNFSNGICLANKK